VIVVLTNLFWISQQYRWRGVLVTKEQGNIQEKMTKFGFSCYDLLQSRHFKL